MSEVRSMPARTLPHAVKRLLASSTFRLAFLGAFLFACTSVGLLALVEKTTIALLDKRVDFAIDGEIDRLHQILKQGGLPALTGEVSVRLSSLQGRQRIYLLVDETGIPQLGNLTEWPDLRTSADNRVYFSVPPRLDDSGSRVRGVVMDLGPEGRLLVGRLQTDRQMFERVVRSTMLMAGAVSLALGVVVGLIMARNAVQRLDVINGTVETILRGELGGRVASNGSGDEFDQVAANLNKMLDRIDSLMSAMRDVTRNIAHDLRTPLTRLRNRLELVHQASGEDPTAESDLGAAIRDVDGIIATFNALLSIARIESQIPRQQFKTVSVGQVLEDVADLYRPLAEDDGLVMELATKASLHVHGDSHLLFQAVANLVDNAIKHTPPGGTVRLGATGVGDIIQVVVADTGPGIPESQRNAVLQPFTRLDDSRQHPGMGLGLSMVAAIVDLHEARLELTDNRPGLRATLIFAKEGYPKRPVM